MKTNFTLAQLSDPAVAESERILRTCVHCGFCTATCPTYVLLGDELDSPRGRIYLIKDIVVHDHCPVRRELHASRRPRARAHRAYVPAPATRPPAARRARQDHARPPG